MLHLDQVPNIILCVIVSKKEGILYTTLHTHTPYIYIPLAALKITYLATQRISYHITSSGIHSV